MRRSSVLKVVLIAVAALSTNQALAQATCTLTCPANITVSNDINQCGAVVTYPAPTTGVNDQCGTITCAPASGSFFPVGQTTITCTATAGPSCTFTSTVNDTQAPSLTPPADVVVTLGQGQTSTGVTFPAPTAADNCPGVTVVTSPPSGSTFSAGQTIVTGTATDASGNTATGTFLVIVNGFFNVPTMSELALVLMALMLVGVVALRRYRGAR